jgi:hypothetical protein
MALPKKSSLMAPLILVGAMLFGFGVYQSKMPKKPEPIEVNSGFVATPTPASPTSPDTPTPQNPRTMQAPDAPPMTKDAAQVAAAVGETTKIEANINGATVKLSLQDAPWLQGIIRGAFGNFREGVLKSLKAEQAKGSLNCAPVLTDIAETAFSNVEKISCTAKDGGQINGEFDEDGEGDLTIEDTNGGRVKVSKSGGDFNVETRNSGE